jgi:hypothetical protein
MVSCCLIKLGVDVAQFTVAKYMVRGRPSPATTGRPSSATGIAAMDLGVLPTVGFRPLYASVPGPRIAGVSSQRRSHPNPPPNGLRGRSPKPFPGKKRRNTGSATATPSMGTSSGNGSPQWVSAIGPLPPGRLGKTAISNAPSARLRRERRRARRRPSAQKFSNSMPITITA